MPDEMMSQGRILDGGNMGKIGNRPLFSKKVTTRHKTNRGMSRIVRYVERKNGKKSHLVSLSNSWKTKFDLIEKAGGPKLPKFKQLSFGERMKVGFNVLAYFFGPVYYLFKGMWRKGLTLFVMCAIAVFLLSFVLELFQLGQFTKSLSYGVWAVYAVRADIDYYKKMVLGENGWW